MTVLEKVTSYDYTYFEYKKPKDGYFHEIKARNIQNGKFYALRFNRNKFDCFFFFIYDRSAGLWHTYALENSEEYGSGTDWNAELMIKLENDLLCSVVNPVFHIVNRKIVYSSIDIHRITYFPEHPEMPFYFPDEIKALSYDENLRRYKYSCPPRYIIISKRIIKNKDSLKIIYMFYGCNREDIYTAVHKNSMIEVTKTNRKARVMAYAKCENIYNIIPKQHCVNICKQD